MRYKNKRSRQALEDFAKYFEWELVEEMTAPKKAVRSETKKQLPVTWAQTPDVMALAGIWKNQQISQEELRSKAWGKRR